MRTFGTMGAMLLLLGAAQGQELAPSGPSVSLLSAPGVVVTRGSSASTELRFRVAAGYHINSNKPHDEFLIPTALKLNAPTDIIVGRVTYPSGQDMAFEFSPAQPINVYSGDFNVMVKVRPLRTVMAGNYVMRGKLRYQACDNRACYPPKNLPVEFGIKVGKAVVKKTHRRSPQSPHVR